MKNLYRVKGFWYQQEHILLDGCCKEADALLLFCMQQGLKITGFLEGKEMQFHYLPAISLGQQEKVQSSMNRALGQQEEFQSSMHRALGQQEGIQSSMHRALGQQEEVRSSMHRAPGQQEEGWAVIRSAAELMERDPQAGRPGSHLLCQEGWEQEWKRLLAEGVPDGDIFVDLFHLEHMRGYYIVINPSAPTTVQRFHASQIQSQYMEGMAIYGRLAARQDTQFVFPGWWGKGDTALMASFMASYKKAKDISRLVMLCARGHEEIIRFFPAVDGILTLSQGSRKALETYLLLSETYDSGNLVRCGFQLGYCGYGKDWSHLEGKPTMLGLFRKSLGLPPDAAPSPIPDSFLAPSKPQMQAFLEQIKEEEAILIIPDANGFYQILDADLGREQGREAIWAFLERLCLGWVRQGRKVYCNLGREGDPCLEGAVPLCLPIPDLLSISQGFRLIYAVRTGLADILALGRNRLQILYHAPATRNLQMFNDATDLGQVRPGIVNGYWSQEGQEALLEELIKGECI